MTFFTFVNTCIVELHVSSSYASDYSNVHLRRTMDLLILYELRTRQITNPGKDLLNLVSLMKHQLVNYHRIYGD